MLNLLHHVIYLLYSRLSKVNMVLNIFPPYHHCTSKRLWHLLQGTLQSLVIIIPGGSGIFFHLHDEMRCTGQVPMTPLVHDELYYWRRLMRYSQARPAHILEVVPPQLTWFGISDASNTGMDGVLRVPNNHPHVWPH